MHATLGKKLSSSLPFLSLHPTAEDTRRLNSGEAAALQSACNRSCGSSSSVFERQISRRSRWVSDSSFKRPFSGGLGRRCGAISGEAVLKVVSVLVIQIEDWNVFGDLGQQAYSVFALELKS